jgi:hypothetical protein
MVPSTWPLDYHIIARTSTTEMSSVATLDVRGIVEAPLAVTAGAPAPSVADGIIASTPFMASAICDNAANPTEGGSYRKTE